MIDRLKELSKKYEQEMEQVTRGSERWIEAFGEWKYIQGRLYEITVKGGIA